MVTKIYGLLWLLAVGAAGLLYFVGGPNEYLRVVFGFVFVTLAFAGLVPVHPLWASSYYLNRK